MAFDDAPRCHAKSVRTGKPCSNPAMRYQKVCGMHGGRSKQAKAAAEERRQRAEAEHLMVTLGEPVLNADAAQIVSDRIGVRAGHVEWLLGRVRALEPDALTWGLTKRKTAVAPSDDPNSEDEARKRAFAGTDEGDTHEAKPHIWYAMYVDAARDLEKLCLEAIRVGLDERRVRLAEQQASLWVKLIDGVLRDLGHDPNDPATADIVVRHLEAVA